MHIEARFVDQGGESGAYIVSHLPYLGNKKSERHVNDPGWRFQLGKLNLTTVMSAHTSSYEGLAEIDLSCRTHWQFGIFRETHWSGNPPMYDLDPTQLFLQYSDRDDQIGIAGAKLASKIYQIQRGKFAGGVFLGEMAETIHFVKSPLAQFKRACDAIGPAYKFYRKAISAAKGARAKRNLLKQWNQVYLEWTYAVIPLCADIKDLQQRVQDLSEKRPVEYAKVNVTDTDSDHFGLYPDNLTDLQCSHTVHRRVNISIKGKAMVKLDVGNYGNTAADFGVRVTDFVPTVYELIPYSFLFDYFSNLGTWIEGNLAALSQCPWAYFTIVEEAETTILTKYAYPDTSDPFTDYVHVSSSGVTKARQRQVTRVKVDWVKDYTLGFHIPSVRSFVNIASLLAAFNLK